MQHPDEGMIHTWLDGELSPEDSAAFEEHVASCKQCADAVAEARGLVAASSRIVSALDIVPGGVIPIAKARPKAWYSSAQFRAAAAVVVVAGASLLVFKNENRNGATVMERATAVAEKKATPAITPTAAPVTPAPVAKDQPRVAGPAANSSIPPASAPTAVAAKVRQAVPPVAVADAAVRRDATARLKDEDFSGRGVKGGTSNGVAGTGVAQSERAGFANVAEEPKAGNALMGKVAGVANPIRPTGVLDQVVVTGVATKAVEPEARLIRVDSTKTPRQSFYETAKGARLVLTELESPAFAAVGSNETTSATPNRKSAGKTLRAPMATVMTPPSAPILDPMIQPPVAAAQASAKPVINTITWFDSTGLRRYVLSGPASVAELETVRAQIMRQKQ